MLGFGVCHKMDEQNHEKHNADFCITLLIITYYWMMLQAKNEHNLHFPPYKLNITNPSFAA